MRGCLNIQGSCNNLRDTAPDPAEYAARNLANIAHHDFLGALRDEVIAFRKPVAYVQGDSHDFRIDKPFQDASGRSALTQGPLARSPRLVLGARDSALVGVSPQLGRVRLDAPSRAAQFVDRRPFRDAVDSSEFLGRDDPYRSAESVQDGHGRYGLVFNDGSPG